MGINLSRLLGTPDQNSILATLTGDPPHSRQEFTGSFRGLAHITSGGVFDIAGRWIREITLDGNTAHFDLAVPAPLDFNGVKWLELYFDFDGTSWRTGLRPMDWLKHNSKIEVALGTWLRDTTSSGELLLRMHDITRGFPLDKWGLSNEPMEWTRNALYHSLNAGVFLDRKGQPTFVIAPQSETKSSFGTASTGLQLIGLETQKLGSKASDSRYAPLALAFPVGQAEGVPTWQGIVHWAPVQTHEDWKADHRLNFNPILDAIWNTPVERGLLGMRLENSAQPLVPLPRLHITEEEGHSTAQQTPILFIDVPRDDFSNAAQRPRVRHVFISGADKATVVTADFPLHSKATNQPSLDFEHPVFRFKGTISKPLHHVPTDAPNSANTREDLRTSLEEAVERMGSVDSNDVLMSWEAVGTITAPASAGGWLVWGSLQFKLPDAANDKQRLQCYVRGTWTADECDTYPECILELDGCEVRPSVNADAADRDLFAAFGVKSGLEDDLQRESDILRFARNTQQPSRKCDLTIRHRTDRGRIAVSRVEVRAKDRSRFGDESVVLQLRPFSVAVVQPVDIDSEAGDLIAVWSSNDPEGVQWRLPDATATITLPPQAVGEAMERGGRFWKPGAKGQTWIDTAKPIAYRFSPPTQLTVRPSIREQRYNKSPSNFSALLANAKVESFTTETMYPIQAKFEISALGLPDIRVRETGAMLGRPSENLPPPYDIGNDPRDKKAVDRWFRNVFASEIAAYASKLSLDPNPVAELRERQAAAKATFAARLAEYHIYDPWSAEGRLDLTEGLSFRLRDTRYGARPLINPLPHWIVDKKAQVQPIPDDDLLDGQKAAIHVDESVAGPQFLGKDRSWAEGHDDGAFVGGVVHTMEFPSELVAVLRKPVATRGKIDSLAFTALGANAHMAVSFDEGRTIFVGETSYGQISRLIKIRVGRVAVLWNRARHVIVYERTTVPSQQFVDEQQIEGVESRGWPILRKTEEYVEPLEPIRTFADEAQTKDNRAGFIEASEFITPRVYVNGAWGRDLGHGYEIPLWNEEDTSGFYPKPKLAVRAYAGGAELSRCLLDEPQHVFFYSNTEPGRGDQTDTWPSFRGVDQPQSIPRVKVVTNVLGKLTGPERQTRIIDASQLPGPRLGGLRRPRFDLKVACEGKVNLQHARGQTEMLAVMDIVSMMRTTATGADKECREGVDSPDPRWTERLDRIKAESNVAGEIASAQALRAKADAFMARAFERLASGATCRTVKDQLLADVNTLFKDAKEAIHGTMMTVPEPPSTSGLVQQSVAQLRSELRGVEKTIRASFDKVLADIEAIRANPQKDLEAARKRALDQFLSGTQIAKSVLGVAKENIKGWQARLDGTIQGGSGAVLAHLRDAKASTDQLVAAANKAYDQLDIEGAQRLCVEAIPKLRALEHHAVYGKAAGRCADAIAGMRKYFDRNTLSEEFWSAAQARLQEATLTLSNGGTTKPPGLIDLAISAAEVASMQAQGIVDDFAVKSTAIAAKLEDAVKVLETTAANQLALALQKVVNLIDDVHHTAAATATAARDDLIEQWIKVCEGAIAELMKQAVAMEQKFDTMLMSAVAFARRTAELLDTVASGASVWLDKLRTEITDWIENKLDCSKVEEMRAQMLAMLCKAEDEVRDRITGMATSLIDESTQAKFRELERTIGDEFVKGGQVADEVAKGVKLVKALGELPQLPTLTFNADRAEYVFDDLKQQIETSSFAAKLREIDTGLKELGLAVPTNQLLDQIVPASLKDIDFSKVFRNMGAMDFTDFFKRFRLPEIRQDQLQVTHGLDKKTRTAWVSTKVNAQFDQEQSLFEFAGIAVTLAKLDMKATSDMSVGLNGEHSSRTDAKLQADWGLGFSGTKLAMFREVLVHYDGSKFDFNIEPSKVELHPALKFVDEFAKRFQPELPPAVELVKDSRGIPVGAKAQMHTEVVLPPLGIVEIGPMLICAGLAMRMSPEGQFKVEATVSVGSRDAPVWVQVSYLGGGMWLEARAWYDEGVHYEASVGLALGCIKAFNIASVARGSFAFLLFAYATMSDKTGGSLRAGLQVAGNARIVGIANASILLLLEAVHGGGKTEGHGSLDVSIDICWCYTLHVRKDVNHQVT